MAFIKDIFISYAHIDNESLLEGDKGWISEFHRSLEVRLGQLYGKRPTIWRDQKLTGNDMFDNEIIDQLPQVKLMISVISPRYLKSDWCLKEVNAFHDACQENIGFNINNKVRLFKVIKTPVRVENYPDLIRDQLGYEFFNIDPDTGRPHEFGQIFGEKAQLQYWAKLDDLAHDITYMLEEFDKVMADSSYSETLDQSIETNKTIYLADTSYDMKNYRDEVKRELLDLGFKVLPNHNLPLYGDDLRKEVNQYLTEADLCLQMFGSKYGIIPEGEEKSVVELQQELARAASTQNGLQRMIWLPSEQDRSGDTRMQSLVEQILSSDEEQAGSELITASIQDFKRIVHDNFKKPAQADPDPVDAQPAIDSEELIDDTPPLIYLICTEEDLDNITAVEDYLYEKGFEVTIPAFEGEEEMIRQDNLENLRNCDAALIYFGSGSDLWMRSKIRDLIKVVGYGRKRPLTNKTVYVDQPVTRSKERFRSQGVTVINGIDGFKHELFNELIDRLENDR